MSRWVAIVSSVFIICLGASATTYWTPETTTGGLVCSRSSGVINPAGGPIIWPWGQEITFPWSGIQGIWQVSGSNCQSLFMFRMIQQNGNEKVLDITEYDPTLCSILARGKGVESNRVVRAVLAGANGSFEMTIHAFNFKQSGLISSGGYRYRNDEIGSGTVVAMKIYPLGGKPTKQSIYKIDRLEKNPAMLCE